MIIHFWVVIWIISIVGLSWGDQQYYVGGGDSCSSSDVKIPGTRYTCESSPHKCQTFLVFRANDDFDSIAKISALFNMTSRDLLAQNNNGTSAFQALNPGQEVVVPVRCSCKDGFYRANLSYIVSGNLTFSDIGCGVYQGLVNSGILSEENHFASSNSTLQVGLTLQVPLKCACPDKNSSIQGVKYLVTYPIIEKDDPNSVCKKFNIPVNDVLDTNHLDPFATVYPETTILVPLKSEPSINFDSPVSPPPSTPPSLVPIEPVKQPTKKNTQLQKVYISVSVVGFFLVLITMVACGLYIKALRKFRAEKSNPFTQKSSLTSCSTPRSSQLSGPAPPKSSTASPLSPDLLESIKYSLGNYTVDEIKKATNDFSEENRITDAAVYKGFIDDAEILIKLTRFEDTKEVIDVHTKINHVHIVKLHGVCYGDDDNFSWCYLIFDSPSNGSLRRCLSSSNPSFGWKRRAQIAFDIATGLHYLHYCVVPPHTHKSVSSKTIFLTRNWRAKVAVFEALSIAAGTSNDHHHEKNITSSKGGWGHGSSDHFSHVFASEQKEDVFAFGVVLLELISGREDLEEKPLTESIAFLGGAGASDQGGCFDQLRKFVDPSLKDDYPLAEALCLAVLAKACIEDDPLHRPSMDDVLKVLGRMV